jgi:uncharacterized protein YbjT (DUF2867 family)
MPDNAVHVIGASGRSGTVLCRSLRSDGIPVVPVVRDAAKYPGARVADITNAERLRDALRDATRVVSCAHARFAPAVIDAAPEDARFVFLGSTRKFTRWPDEHGNGVIAGEAAFLASGRSGVMLHPTMIYGAQGENNVQRLAALLRRLPLVPLPGGGRTLVQPIHQDDVTRSIRSALDASWQGPHSLVIAGPAPLPYADFVRAIAAATGLRPPLIIPLPVGLLIAAARLLRAVTDKLSPEEIRRLDEDKAFSVGPMEQWLGVRSIPLDAGLALTFGRASSADRRR